MVDPNAPDDLEADLSAVTPAAPPAEASALPACPVTDERLAPRDKRCVDFKGPAAVRGMAAKGMVPLQGADFLHVLFMLTFDPDEKIRAQARETASAKDERTKKTMLAALRDESLDPPVLDFYAHVLAGKDDLLELVALNNSTTDETIADLVQHAGPKLAELISQNQLRLLRTPLILRNLCGNANTSKATVDLACDFAIRSGVVMDDVPGLGVDIDETLAAKYPYERAYLPVARLRDGSMWNW